MRGLIFATLLFAAVAFARYKIFDLDGAQPTSAMYDKPVWLRSLVLPKASIPQGYTIVGAENPHPIKADRALNEVPQLSKAQLPQPSEITEYLVQSFAGTMGDKVHVVTARYANKQAAERAGLDRYKGPKFYVVDYYLTWIDSPTDEAASQFHAAFDANAKQQKKRRGEMEKVVVAGNAYLKFFADLLVGAFGFMLALFFAKYFLIMRNVED
jgi:hypothetical protein